MVSHHETIQNQIASLRTSFAGGLVANARICATGEDTERINRLASRVSNLENRIPYHTEDGAALFLFGAFCALWAQNTGRNPWLWFFMGLLFSVITVLVLLSKNADDKKPKT